MNRSFVALLGAALLLLAVPAGVAAHSGLATSDPRAAANLDEPPAEVVLTFDGELDPASRFSVTDRDDAVVGTGALDLDVAGRDVLRGDVEISEPGVYTVTWTAVSLDGHEETGSFSFGYRSDPDDGSAGPDSHDEGTPDTALPGMHAPTGLTLAGLACLAAAIGVGARRSIGPRATQRA